MFLQHLVYKVAVVSRNIVSTVHNIDLDTFPVASAVFEEFDPVSLLVSKVVHGMAATSCAVDIIPAKVLKKVFSTAGLVSFHLITVASDQALSQSPSSVLWSLQLLKKPNLDPTV